MTDQERWEYIKKQVSEDILKSFLAEEEELWANDANYIDWCQEDGGLWRDLTRPSVIRPETVNSQLLSEKRSIVHLFRHKLAIFLNYLAEVVDR